MDLAVSPGGIYVVLKNINPVDSDVGLRMRVSVDGGSTFDSGTNYSSSAGYLPTGTEANVFNTSQAQIQFLQEATANAALGTNLNGWIWMRTISTPATFSWQFTHVDAAGTFRASRGVGRYEGSGPLTHVQFLMESGNIASGEFLSYRMV